MLTVKNVRKAVKGSTALYVVYLGADPIGLLERYRNTARETHPWKAYGETGAKAVYLGAFYDDGSVIPLDRDMLFGGRKAAIQAIQTYHDQLQEARAHNAVHIGSGVK